MLEFLSLTECNQLTSVAGLSGCRALKTLHLSWCENLRDLSGLAGCSTLQQLTLTGGHVWGV